MALTSVGQGVSVDISDNSANDAAAWMHNRLDRSIHLALNTDNPHIADDNDKQAFALLTDEKKLDLYGKHPIGLSFCIAHLLIRRAIYTEAESHKLAFTKTVDEYNTDARRHDMVVLDIRAEHTWEQVMSMERGFLEHRQAADKSKGFKGFIHTGMRRFGDNSESFQAWLGLLPTESHYLSVLCGGLKLLLGVSGYDYPEQRLVSPT